MKTNTQPDPDTLVLPAEMKWDDEGWCDVSCPALPVYTCARSEAEAKDMLIDAVEGFCDSCREYGAFDAILKKVGYNGNNPLPIIKLDLNGELLEVRHLRSFESEAGDAPKISHA